MQDEIKHWDGPPLEAWQCFEPHEAALLLAGLDAPWCVVGGWAIDLFLGRRTRTHDDLEIAVPRIYFDEVRTHLEGRYALHAVGVGEVRRLAPGVPYPADKHQCWVLDEEAGKWRVDIMQEPGDRDRWVYRRNEIVHAPRSQMLLRTESGIPFLAPEGVLLFKSGPRRPKDERDFEVLLPALSASSRAWLRQAISQAHPDCPWTERLQDEV
jgi:aminoglycoside-2''-adenylyltransferase